jgi:hypothetical protein
MKCCGSDRATPYCPICGTRLKGAAPLNELLNHCRTNAKKLIGKQRYDRSGGGEHVLDEEQDRKGRRWQEWADALAELMEKASGGA